MHDGLQLGSSERILKLTRVGMWCAACSVDQAWRSTKYGDSAGEGLALECSSRWSARGGLHDERRLPFCTEDVGRSLSSQLRDERDFMHVIFFGTVRCACAERCCGKMLQRSGEHLAWRM
jgi:hypothetical protein